MSIHLSPQSATALERKAFLHWVMLFIKLYRNPVACLSGQSISRSSIMISTTPACCYVVMFWGWSVFLKPFEELAVFKKRKRHIFRLISLTWWQRLRKKQNTTIQSGQWWVFLVPLHSKMCFASCCIAWVFGPHCAEWRTCSVSYLRADFMLNRRRRKVPLCSL